MNPDDLDHLLEPPAPLSEEGPREAVWEETFGYLRRQKRRRDVVRFTSYAALLALAAAAGWAAKPVNFVLEPPERLIAQVPTPSQTETTPPRTAQQLELDAERVDDLIQSARLYRDAGDRYLEQSNDIRSALRCYRQHLELLGSQDRTVAVSDSWLLLSLKRARNQGEVQ